MFQIPLHFSGNNLPFSNSVKLLELETLCHTEDFRGCVKVLQMLLNVLEGAKDIGAPHSKLH